MCLARLSCPGRYLHGDCACSKCRSELCALGWHDLELTDASGRCSSAAARVTSRAVSPYRPGLPMSFGGCATADGLIRPTRVLRTRGRTPSGDDARQHHPPRRDVRRHREARHGPRAAPHRRDLARQELDDTPLVAEYLGHAVLSTVARYADATATSSSKRRAGSSNWPLWRSQPRWTLRRPATATLHRVSRVSRIVTATAVAGGSVEAENGGRLVGRTRRPQGCRTALSDPHSGTEAAQPGNRPLRSVPSRERVGRSGA